MDKDWIFKADEYICDLRTVGVLIRDGKLLVQRDRDGSEYALPGGHVKIGETTVDLESVLFEPSKSVPVTTKSVSAHFKSRTLFSICSHAPPLKSYA